MSKKFGKEELLKWLENNLNRSAMLQASHPHLAWYPTEKDKQNYTQVRQIIEEHFEGKKIKIDMHDEDALFQGYAESFHERLVRMLKSKNIIVED